MIRKTRTWTSEFVLAILTVLVLPGCPGPSVSPGPGPAPAVSGVRVVNVIPESLSTETNQDSEPFLAVHPTNRKIMAASAFTPNPAGSNSPTAPIFVSQDGGDTWTLNNIVPSTGTTADITHAFDQGPGELYAGILRRPNVDLSELVTVNVLAPTSMTLQKARPDVDQPFVQVTSNGSANRLYVGNNDFNAGPRTATVDVSLDGGTTWTSVRIEHRSTSGQDGPSIRPAVAGDGTVYVAFLGWRSFNGAVATSDVVVVRDDTGGTTANPFLDLTDVDGLPGRRVAQNVTIPWVNAEALGQQRIGSTLSLAVDPSNSAIVYLGWCDRVGTGDIYTLHVRRSMDRGVTWSVDLRTRTNATNVALSVANNGTVGMLYQQVQGGRWVTHLEQTRNGFSTVQDTVLASVPADFPIAIWQPYIGDYIHLVAVDDEFHGTFSASNVPDKGNFPNDVRYQRKANFGSKRLEDGSGGNVSVSIDPFYFSVPVMK